MEKEKYMKTFEDYLVEQIGLNYAQCHEMNIKKELIKDFFEEWCYEYSVDRNIVMDTIETMEGFNIFL